MNLNIDAEKQTTFDAIVVGSGVSGGWAAKELSEKGLKVLMIERGPDHKHIESYTHAMTDPWQLPHRGQITNEIRAKFPYMTTEGAYPVNETNEQFWFPFADSPYIREKPFDWYQGFGTGGKSLLWGRMVFRWSNLDFEANLKEGVAIDWPIRYEDLKPWYEKVERFIGVSGEALGLDHFPDSIFQPPMEMNCVEKDFKTRIKEKYGDSRVVTIGRVAHLTEATEEQKSLGRSNCQYRNACAKGCPYGAYFSTNSATLPAAMKTGNLTLLTDAIVSRVIFDKKNKKAKGVEVIDRNTKESRILSARILFINASTAGSTQILLNSVSNRFPNGMGNDNGVLGHYLMDHHSRAGASGTIEGYENEYYFGRRANGIFIPRFRNLGNDKRDYLRGFDFQGGASRGRGAASDTTFGSDFKENLTKPGPWSMNLGSFGECLPYESNRLFLHPTQKDQYGMPTIVFDAEFKENERKMREDMKSDSAELLEAFGVKNIQSYAKDNPPLGLSKHEMGTARMGRDPKTSVLNAHNQIWDCKNVFVTDGACMTSSSYVNPSLTYMALTARATDYAVSEMKKSNL